MLNQSSNDRSGSNGFTNSWIPGAGNTPSVRRRLFAILRMAHRSMGMSRKRLGIGALGFGGKVRSGAAGIALSVVVIAGVPTNANAALVSACSGVSLPPSVVTDILSPVLSPIFNAPIISLLGLGPIFDSIAAGDPIGLNVLDVNGDTVLSNAQCDTTSDSFSLDTPKGIAIGGNKITGLGVGTTLAEQALAATDDGIAFGNAARSNTAGSIAIGSNARVDVAGDLVSSGGTAIGTNASVTGGTTALPSTALGYNAQTVGVAATALGGNASATGGASTALGAGASATSQFGVALGAGSVASTAGGVVGFVPIGSSTADAARVAATNSTAGIGAVSVGTADARRQIINVAAGTADSDAVNVGQLSAVGNQISSITNGGGIKYFRANSTQPDSQAIGVNSVAIGPDAVATGAGSIAQGNNAQAIGAGGVAIGRGATTGSAADLTRINQVAIGNNASATAQNSTAVGDRATATGPQATAFGSLANATGANSTAIGRNTAAGISGTALGTTASSTGTRSTALGQSSEANVTDGVAVGFGTSVTAVNSVALGSSAVAARGAQVGYTGYGLTAAQTSAGEVSIGTAAAQRQLTNLAAGSAATDAVNVGQLNQVSQNFATTLGSTVNAATGAYTAPAYIVGGATYTTVPTAIAAQDGIVAAQGAGVAAQLGGGEVYDPATGTFSGGFTVGGTAYTDVASAITDVQANSVQYDDTTKTSITLGGVGAAAPVALTNVAAGALNATSTDAVNGSQLFATNEVINTINNGGGIKYFHANSVLGDSQAVGSDSVAIGPNAQSNGRGAVALGSGALTSGNFGGTAIGGGDGSLTGTNIAGQFGSTLGFGAQAKGVGDIAIGAKALTGDYNPADPTDDSTNSYRTAVGYGSVASGNTSVALGAFNSASGERSVAIGFASNASAVDSVALGSNTVAARGAQTGYTGFGLIAPQTSVGEVSVGAAGAERQITNVAAGSAGTDAVNVDQLTSVALVANNSVQYDDATKASITLGGGAGGTTITNVAAGDLTDTSTDAVNGSQLFTTNAQVTTNTTNIGALQQNALLFDPLLGAFNAARAGVATIITNVAAGDLSDTSTDAVNGSQLFTTNQNVTNITNNIDNGTVGLVRQVGSSPGTGQITVGAQTGGTSVSLAGTDGNRVLTNVAAGALNTTSTDAVNGAQLNATNTNVTNLGNSTATSLGGGSTYDNTTGTISAPTYAVQGGSYNNVGDAFSAIDTQTTTNTTDISNLTQNINNGSVGLVRQTGGAPGEGPITIGALTGGTSINLAGTSGNRVVSGVAAGVAGTDAVNVAQLTDAILGATNNAVTYDNSSRTSLTLNAGGASTTISNVAAGALTDTSTDAVNGSQLNATNTQVATNTTSITAIKNGAAGAFRSNNTSGLAQPVATGADAVAGGFGAVASGARSTALGAASSATGTNSVALGYGSTDGGRSNVVSVGAAGSERQIANVAAGTRATDAVNLGQLNSGLAGANAYTDSRFSALDYDLRRARRDASAGTASAMAAAGLPQAFTPGAGMIAGGMGVYRDQTAFAIGASKIFNDGHTIVKGGATYTDRSSTFGANVGIGYQF